MSTACSYCQVTLVGLENGKRFKTIMDSTPIFYALDVRTWTPPFAKRSAHDGLRDRLHPYIRTFGAAHAAVPDGIG